MTEDMLNSILFFLFFSGALYAVFRVVSQVIARKRAPEVRTAELEQRLAHIEQIVESTAIEVERISEGNRFVAKLLAERHAEQALPRPSARVVTPH